MGKTGSLHSAYEASRLVKDVRSFRFCPAVGACSACLFCPAFALRHLHWGTGGPALLNCRLSFVLFLVLSWFWSWSRPVLSCAGFVLCCSSWLLCLCRSRASLVHWELCGPCALPYHVFVLLCSSLLLQSCLQHKECGANQCFYAGRR